MNAHEELLDYIEQLEIIDTHEHLPLECDRPPDSDVLSEYLTHYFSCDLVSAGLQPKSLQIAVDPSRDLMKRWKLIEPYWNAARSTTYARALDLSARDLYGIDEINRKTIRPLNEAFIAARERGKHYQYVLKEKSRIALSIVDSVEGPEVGFQKGFFVSAVRMDDFICPKHRCDLVRMGEEVGVRVHCLDDWKEAMELTLDRAGKRKGTVALKCGLAYMRSLGFTKTTHAEAEREFNELFANEHSPEWRDPIKMPKAFQDYMMHALLRLADQCGLTFQFHTGIQEGHGNVITDSNPVLLTNLFLEYENVKFDLFHMGYPYVLEVGNLAKNFRNVFIDMCWGHIVAAATARRCLVEWLDAVPANKISAFGGDYLFVDAVYGHQKIARQNVAASLAQKLSDADFDMDRAKQIAHWVFIDNPTNLFNLKRYVRKPKRITRRRKEP